MVGLGYENFIEERKFPEPSSTLKILSTLTSSTKVALYCRGSSFSSKKLLKVYIYIYIYIYLYIYIYRERERERERERVGKILGKQFFQLVSTIGSFHENFFAFEIYSYK